MRVYITGVAGFLGSHLCDGALEKGWIVHGIDNLFRGRATHMPESENFTFEQLDLCGDISALSTSIQNFKPDVILHYGAINGTEYFYDRPFEVLDTNVMATINLLKAIEACQHKPKRIAYASSSEVYGEYPDNIPSAETDITRLDIHSIRDSYAAAKSIGDFYVRMFAEQYDIEWTLLRIFNAYGGRMDASKFGQVVPEFVKRALFEDEFTIIGDGLHTRAFCHVDDHVRMVLTLVESEKGIGVFNIGNDEEITMLHLAEEVHKVVGREFSPIHLPKRSNDPLRRQPDMTKTWAITGPCQISLREGLTYTAEYYREQ